ncbi:MAG: hypothetical protein MAG794_00725 [Gammaproteobacteria bacterium]|nr:hypothetical protein [Gammaproteobacteria bacterium]
MKAKSLDKKFDEGKEISKNLDLSQARRPLQEQKRVNVDFPKWMIDSLDKEASRLGVTRQSIIKVWLSERLQQGTSNKALHDDAQKARG